MKLLIDTNIFLDVLAKREPFYDASRRVLMLCEEKKIYGFLTASSVTDLFYLVQRLLHSTEEAYKAVGCVLDIAKVLNVTNDDVLKAYMIRAHDFEDCLQPVCAQANGCDGIVTRNQKDFASFGIALYTPEELPERI